MAILVSQDVLDGLEAVRESGKTNMIDYPMVAKLAKKMGYSETYDWIILNPNLYGDGIFMGFEVE